MNWVEEVLEENNAIAGSPQDTGLKWTHLNPQQTVEKLGQKDLEVSPYVVQQVYKHLNLRRRKMFKTNSLKEVEGRNEQFEKINDLRAAFLEAGLPVFSIDTKKKEMLGNFQRPGHGYGTAPLPVNDHDFLSFSDGPVIPHGIYDETQNKGYISLGTTKDTSAFICDNFRHYWIEDFQWQYPDADMALIFCDGGGSNNATHYIVKKDLYELAQDLQITLVIAHYPPYCSKWNRIEHRLFPHLHRAWEGATFSNLKIVKELAEQTSTKTGLEVKVRINSKDYVTGRKVPDEFKDNIENYICFDEKCPKLNYIIRPQIL